MRDSLDANNLLPILSQIGVAVFTGADSKIMMNRTPAPRKVCG